jgi:hypothetical protein
LKRPPRTKPINLMPNLRAASIARLEARVHPDDDRDAGCHCFLNQLEADAAAEHRQMFVEWKAAPKKNRADQLINGFFGRHQILRAQVRTARLRFIALRSDATR